MKRTNPNPNPFPRASGRLAGPIVVAVAAALALAGLAMLVLQDRSGPAGEAALPAGDGAAAVPSKTPAAADAIDPDRLVLGARLYAEACASCHGADLEGQPDWRERGANGRLPAPPHDETGHTWHHPDEYLFLITKHGVAPFAGPDYESDMPAFEQELTDDGIRAVIDYIKSRWPDDIRARQAEIDAAARAQQ